MNDILSQLELLIDSSKVKPEILRQVADVVSEDANDLLKQAAVETLRTGNPHDAIKMLKDIRDPILLEELGNAFLDGISDEWENGAQLVSAWRAIECFKEAGIDFEQRIREKYETFLEENRLYPALHFATILSTKGSRGEKIMETFIERMYSQGLEAARENRFSEAFDMLKLGLERYLYADVENSIVTDESKQTYKTMVLQYVNKLIHDSMFEEADKMVIGVIYGDHFDEEGMRRELRPLFLKAAKLARREKQHEIAEKFFRLAKYRWTSARRKEFLDEWFEEEFAKLPQPSEEPEFMTVYGEGRPPLGLFMIGLEYKELKNVDSEELREKADRALAKDCVSFAYKIYRHIDDGPGVRRVLRKSFRKGFYSELNHFIEDLYARRSKNSSELDYYDFKYQRHRRKMIEHLIRRKDNAVNSFVELRDRIGADPALDTPENKQKLNEHIRIAHGYPITLLSGHFVEGMHHQLEYIATRHERNPQLYCKVAHRVVAENAASCLTSDKVWLLGKKLFEAGYKELAFDVRSISELLEKMKGQEHAMLMFKQEEPLAKLYLRLRDFIHAYNDEREKKTAITDLDPESYVSTEYHWMLEELERYGIRDSVRFRSVFEKFNPFKDDPLLIGLCDRYMADVIEDGEVDNFTRFDDALKKIDNRKETLRYANKLLRRGHLAQATELFEMAKPHRPYTELRAFMRKTLLAPFKKDIRSGLELLLAATNSEEVDDFEISVEQKSFDEGRVADVQSVSFRAPKLLGNLAIVVKMETPGRYAFSTIEIESRIYDALRTQGIVTPTTVAVGDVDGKQIGVFQRLEGVLLKDALLDDLLVKKSVDNILRVSKALTDTLPAEYRQMLEENYDEGRFYSSKMVAQIKKFLGVELDPAVFSPIDTLLCAPEYASLKIVTRDANPTNLMLLKDGRIATFDFNVLRNGYLYEEWNRFIDHPGFIPDEKRESTLAGFIAHRPTDGGRLSEEEELKIFHAVAIYRNTLQAALRFDEGHDADSRWFYRRAIESASRFGDERIVSALKGLETELSRD